MEDNYFNIKRCSNSELTRIKRELLGLPPLFAKEQTLYFGKMFHLALFEKKKYNKSFETLSMTDRLMTDVMLKESFKSSMIKAFVNNPATKFEQVKLFEFEGVPFKMKLDAILGKWIADAKTTTAATLEDFIATFDQYGYWRQAALYMIGTGADKFTFWGIKKSHTQSKVFIVDVSHYPQKMKEAIEEAKLLTLHYQKRNEKE